ncbi:DUF6712 family protein [Pedobacter antarcticus]|uniref:DUF6712 family protein n=1 Tax=Pedobacter antarcticus TaxID=34086 RepID=UPI00292FAE5D|nr:DUF6712 family protein [Pedobacter antarcticus]
MKIIDSVLEIKEHYSAIQSGLNISDIKSYIDDAINLHLVRAIGLQQYSDLVAMKNKEDSSAAQKHLIFQLQRSAAGFTLAYYTNSGAVQINSAGISVIKGNNSAPVSDKKLAALKKQCMSDGYRSLEHAVILMENSPLVFTAYHTSQERQIQRSRILSVSTEYSNSGILITPQLCQALTGFQQSIEQDIIEPLLGENLLKHIKACLLSGPVSPKEQQLIDKIRLVMSRLILAEAILYLPIVINEDDGCFDLSPNADSSNQIHAAVQNRLVRAMIMMRDNGESNLESLRKWLKKNALEFSTYTLPAEIKMNDSSCSNIYSFL